MEPGGNSCIDWKWLGGGGGGGGLWWPFLTCFCFNENSAVVPELFTLLTQRKI
jgi:hypothetical protein